MAYSMRNFFISTIFFTVLTTTIDIVRSNPSQDTNGLITQTVYGFLDFTTTIGNTIMVFSPQSSPAVDIPTEITTTPDPIIQSNPIITHTEVHDIQPTKIKSKQTSVVNIIGNDVDKKLNQKQKLIGSSVFVITGEKESATPIHLESENNIKSLDKNLVKPTKISNKQIYSSIVEIRTEPDNSEPALPIGNNIGEPEYDFLSRQPAEYAEETYRVINLRPSNGKQSVRHKSTQDLKKIQTIAPKVTHPTGLVTKLSGTLVKDGITTIHETSVIGTYISGKYAQVLQSTAHIHKNNRPKITPSSTLRILKTTAPTHPTNRAKLESSSSSSNSDNSLQPGEQHNNIGPSYVRASRRPVNPSGNYKNRFQSRPNKDDGDIQQQQGNLTPKKSSRNSNKPKNSRYGRNRSSSSIELATVSVFSELSTPSSFNRRYKSPRSGGFKPTQTSTQSLSTSDSFSRRNFKAKIQPSNIDPEHSISIHKFKLNRPSGRFPYKTSLKPRVTVKKIITEEHHPTSQNPQILNPEVTNNEIPAALSRSDSPDIEAQGSNNGEVLINDDIKEEIIEKTLPIETLKVDISTPVDFKDTYFEIATIKTPYTFQVGTVKNTRYITVTSTFEKTLEPEPTATPTLTNEPITENILAPSQHLDKEQNLLDSSMATLPPLYIASDAETPPLETLTETFSTTQEMLKTHILPVIKDGMNATSYTLIQTYHITRLVTATKTLPPMDAYQFVPSKRLKEFNTKLDEAGSELHLELEFGDEGNEEEEEDDDEDETPINRQLPPELDLANIGSDLSLLDIDRVKLPVNPPKVKKIPKVTTEAPMPNLSHDQLQQLNFLRLLNPAAAAQIPQVITTSKPIVRLHTVYESHVIPIFNGQSTIYSTISRSIGTISRTEFELATSTLPALPIPQVPVNPLFGQQQQFQITTSPIITQTHITQTNSQVLKLTFGAKTSYTTLLSTTVIPTLLTTYYTASIPVQQTAAYPGYFPAPYVPFPFVG